MKSVFVFPMFQRKIMKYSFFHGNYWLDLGLVITDRVVNCIVKVINKYLHFLAHFGTTKFPKRHNMQWSIENFETKIFHFYYTIYN